MNALPTEVESALQQAIGQANRAYVAALPNADAPGVGQRKKGKKRAREDTVQTGETTRERKRKKTLEDGDGTVSTADPNIDPSLTGPTVDFTKKKKTEKKTSKKRKQSDTHSAPEPPTVDSELDLPQLSNETEPAALNQAGTSTSQSYHPSSPPQGSHPPSTIPGDDSVFQPNNNDDILRAFQGLDLTRLAGVLRSLDLPSSHVDLDTTDNPFAALLHPNGLADDQQTLLEMVNSTKATEIPGAASSASPRTAQGSSSPSTVPQRPSKPPKSAPKPNPNLAAIGPSIANPEHTTMLATKWLSASKLKELVETEGLVYKKGKFSTLEEQALKAAIENYRVNQGLTPEQITDVVFSKAKEEHSTFWSDITAALPARPIIAVYHHVHRAYHPLKLQGKWSQAEDSALVSAIGDLGQAWQKISDRVGRAASDCRDRWRNHVAHRSKAQKGRWSKAEEEELTRIVQELTTKQGKDADNDVFWGIVSERMGNKRGRQQCRIKWTDSLNKTVKNGGENPRWNRQDAFILVHKVASLDVRDDSEIDWKLLPDEDWNLWSAHTLQRRWRTLKYAIKGHEEMAFQDIVEILKQKNAKLPQVQEGGSKSPRKEPKSAAVIEEDEGGDKMNDVELDT